MTINRAYVFEDHETDENGEPTLKSKIREEMIGKLAAEWNTVSSEIERRSFMDREDRDNEAEYIGDHCENAADNAVDAAYNKNPNLTEDEIKVIRQTAEDEAYAAYKAKRDEIYVRKEVIEELLSELGARMARPYEHWNEDEKYMEYMETRHDNDDRERW